MRIQAVALYRYALPLARPLYVRGSLTGDREGVVLVLTDESGCDGIGEAAPLALLSTVTLDTVIDELKQCACFLLRKEVPLTVPGIRAMIESARPAAAMSAPARFALESAMVTLSAASLQIPVARFLHPQSAGQVPVRTLMTNAQDLLEAGSFYAGGSRSFKVKVGNDPLKDAAAIDTLARETGPDVSICADANRRWPLEEAVRFAKAIRDTRLEYFEDPCSDWADLPGLSGETGIPLALDEGLDFASLARDGMVPGACLVILRPTVQGAVFQTLDMIAWAARLGVGVVLSSSYESGVGRCMLAGLAACAVPVMPAGLDTGKFFRNDLTGEGPEAFRPYRAVDALPLSLKALNREYLTEVPL